MAFNLTVLTVRFFHVSNGYIKYILNIYTKNERCDMMNTNKRIKNRGELKMTTKIQKWGGSLGVRIPKSIADQFGVENGSQVEISANENGIVVRPIRKEPTLEELMAQITKQNAHEEIDFGRPEGNEVW